MNYAAMDVKKLREETGATFADCKNALTEAKSWDDAVKILEPAGGVLPRKDSFGRVAVWHSAQCGGKAGTGEHRADDDRFGVAAENSGHGREIHGLRHVDALHMNPRLARSVMVVRGTTGRQRTCGGCRPGE